jgi:hypothetical protein
MSFFLSSTMSFLTSPLLLELGHAESRWLRIFLQRLLILAYDPHILSVVCDHEEVERITQLASDAGRGRDFLTARETIGILSGQCVAEIRLDRIRRRFKPSCFPFPSSLLYSSYSPN